MSRGLALYKRHSMEELGSMQRAIHADPACRNLSGGIHLYTPNARKKLEDIAWAIRYHLDDKKEKAA